MKLSHAHQRTVDKNKRTDRKISNVVYDCHGASEARATRAAREAVNRAPVGYDDSVNRAVRNVVEKGK